MDTNDHIQRIKDACYGIDEHCKDNAPAWTALHDIELDIHELEKAFEQKIEDKEHGCNGTSKRESQ